MELAYISIHTTKRVDLTWQGLKQTHFDCTLRLHASTARFDCTFRLPVSKLPTGFDFANSIMIEFVLMVNKQGQTRLSSYYSWLEMQERTAIEAEVIRKCLSRNEMQCSFMEHREYKIIYRRYASLYFIVGTSNSGDVSYPKNPLQQHSLTPSSFLE